MTAVPRWPGVTLPWYQPARLWLSSGGTCTLPSSVRPSVVIGADTPTAGISILVGWAAVSGAAVGAEAGTGTAVPTLAGMTSAPAGRAGSRGSSPGVDRDG